MAEETVKESCSILMISNDMEWMLAFSKGVQRFFLLNERRAETLEQAESRMLESRPDIVVLAVQEGLPSMDKLRPFVREKMHPPVPVIVIDSKPEGLDQWIKQGAEYACARRDLLSAVKHVQQLMRVAHFDRTLHGVEKNAKAVADRYERIYHDLPDPVAYVQDGLFIDANPAFLHTFGVKDRAALDELTLMSFVPHKSERGIKALLKKATEKEVVPSERFELQAIHGGKVDVNISVSGITIHDEPALQMYFRSTEAGGSGGGTGLDPTTSLAGPRVIAASIKQTQERSEAKAVLGYWVYAWIENYREVWQKDGYKAAEIMMKTVADTTRRFLPPSTEIVRFTDDGLALWLTGKKEESIKRVNGLIAHLDEVVPENIGRLVHPKLYGGIIEITTESTWDELVGKGFRAVRGLAMSQSSDRVAEPMSGDISRKDERRVNEIQAILDEQRLRVQYQPISALEVDGVPRYADRLLVLPPEGDVEGEGAAPVMEMDKLLQVAERFGLARQFDRYKINTLIQDILSYEGDQRALQCYISLSTDTMLDDTFPEWIDGQLRATGIAPNQITFELRLDNLANGFTGAVHLINKMRPQGSRFALAGVGRMDTTVREMLERIKPEVIKLDMREIDTFEDREEEEFMREVKKYAEEHHTMLIADHMESPAQLSRVWPHDIQYIQGDGIVPPMDKFAFDFNEPLF
jgi:hypothetical protein